MLERRSRKADRSIILLILIVVIIVAALTFIPADALGPIVEHLIMVGH
jgi:K+-transporting ATPase ATPase A chain